MAGLARDGDAGRPRFRPIGGMLARVAAGRAGTVWIAAEGRGDKNIQAHARLSVGVSVIGAGTENACRTPATGWVRSVSDGWRYCKVMDYLSSRAGDCQGFSEFAASIRNARNAENEKGRVEPPVAVDREKWPIFKIRPVACFVSGVSRQLRGSPPRAAMAPMAVCGTANRHFGSLFAVHRNRVVATACAYLFPVAWRAADKKRPKGDHGQ